MKGSHPLSQPNSNWPSIFSKPLSGILVECDTSIKAIILKIDSEKHDFLQTLVIKESMLSRLNASLEEVCIFGGGLLFFFFSLFSLFNGLSFRLIIISR